MSTLKMSLTGADTFRRSAWTLAGLLVATSMAGGLAMGGCGGGGGSSTSSGTASGGAGGAGGEGGGTACDPPCAAPLFCSSAATCLPPGSCAGDLDCAEPGTVCDVPSATCVPGGECGAQEIAATLVAPNLLVVLDRSCSMTANAGGTPKWTIAVQALTTMLTNFDGQIRFGLTLFPDKVAPSCGQAEIPVPTGPGNEMVIGDLLTAALATNNLYYPSGPCVTNIDTAMQQAATDVALTDTDRDSYVLLLSDGKQSGSCGGDAADPITTAAITDLYQNRGIPTFVIGFDVASDPGNLNTFALAGGVPSPGANAYYDAVDQATLDAALQTIASKTLGCTFALDMPPPDPEKIYVFLDNTKVPRDPGHMAGWDYDPATGQITFYGSDCEDLKAGVVTDVDIVFGCDSPTPD